MRTSNADDLPMVWKALADPTRRRVLDLLRARAMTTGEVVAEFSVSRYAVMKHLDVLVEAGLVFVRRDGRTRWNHLNPVPLQQIYRRFVRPFETAGADALLRLKGLAEASDQGAAMTETAPAATTATAPADAARAVLQAFDIQLEIRIEAPPERVWKSLTEETRAWWPADFYVGSAPLGFHLEPRVGGRVYEDWGDDQGVLWASVLVFDHGKKLQWAGDLAPEFGGPARSITSFVLEPHGAGTLVKFRDSPYGRLSESACKSLEEGWIFLVGECLKPYVETGKRPKRPDSVVDA